MRLNRLEEVAGLAQDGDRHSPKRRFDRAEVQEPVREATDRDHRQQDTPDAALDGLFWLRFGKRGTTEEAPGEVGA